MRMYRSGDWAKNGASEFDENSTKFANAVQTGEVRPTIICFDAL